MSCGIRKCSPRTSTGPTRAPPPWTVDGKVRETRLDDHPQEFPRIDERLICRPHRYGSTMQTSSTGGSAGDSVRKHDLRHGRTTTRQLGTPRTLIAHRTPPERTTITRCCDRVLSLSDSV
jgi:hypothetical protein